MYVDTIFGPCDYCYHLRICHGSCPSVLGWQAVELAVSVPHCVRSAPLTATPSQTGDILVQVLHLRSLYGAALISFKRTQKPQGMRPALRGALVHPRSMRGAMPLSITRCEM